MSLRERIIELESKGGLELKLIGETKYYDGTMRRYEESIICSTPIREKDICIETIFNFNPCK
jgi:hypothetical protein